jgi:PAS domain S-box-containing protein
MAALGGRMETVRRFLKSLWTRGNAPILAVMLLLTGYLCIILSSIYVSQIGLLESRLKQEEDEFQRVAMATEYYFEERKDDLVNLASDREVAVFFENKALGMSMEYGLGLSAIPIVHRFEDLIERKRVGLDTLFSRIVLLDSKANLIADSAPPQTTRKTTKQQWKKFISPKLENGAILLSGDGKEILASTAYYFKEEYAGQIVAWLKPEAIYHFLLQDRQKNNSRYYLLADGGTSHLAVESIASVPPELQTLKFIEEGKPQIHPITDAEGQKADFIVFRMPVADTPFSLVHVRPVKDVLGIMKPWQMLAGMGLLAALIVALIVYLLKVNIRSLVLQTQLGMSEMREKEIQEKNIELENQIAERIKAEAKFRTIFENAPTGICLFDLSGRLTQVNKEWVNLFGAEDAAQLRGMNLLEEPFLLKDGLDALLQGNSIRREIAIDLEKEGFTGNSRKDHDTMLFLDILVTRLAAEAEPESKKYLVHAVDVTAKIRWEEKIRQEEKEKLNEMELLAVSVMSSIPHAVFGLQNGTILFVNNAVESLFGWKPAELIGKDMGLLYRNDREYNDIGSMMYGALEQQKTCSYELEFPCRHKDGRDVLCRVNGARFGDVLKDRKVVVTYEGRQEKGLSPAPPEREDGFHWTACCGGSPRNQQSDGLRQQQLEVPFRLCRRYRGHTGAIQGTLGYPEGRKWKRQLSNCGPSAPDRVP